MAKIMDFQLKSVKTFQGMDGIGLNANLYYKNKKVAFVLDEGHGGELNIQFFEPDKKEEVFQAVKKYYEKYPKFMFYDTDWGKLTEFVEELYALYELEQYFKKQTKKGYQAVVDVRYRKRTDDFMKTLENYKPDCMAAYGKWNAETEEQFLKEFQPIEYTVYQSLEDFIIK